MGVVDDQQFNRSNCCWWRECNWLDCSSSGSVFCARWLVPISHIAGNFAGALTGSDSFSGFTFCDLVCNAVIFGGFWFNVPIPDLDPIQLSIFSFKSAWTRSYSFSPLKKAAVCADEGTIPPVGYGWGGGGVHDTVWGTLCSNRNDDDEVGWGRHENVGIVSVVRLGSSVDFLQIFP